MARKSSLKTEKNRKAFLDAYRSGLTVDQAAVKAGISDSESVGRFVVINYINSADADADFVQEYHDIMAENKRNRVCRLVEKATNIIDRELDKGNAKIAQFVLETQGGWAKNQNLNVNGDMTVDIVYGDEQK